MTTQTPLPVADVSFEILDVSQRLLSGPFKYRIHVAGPTPTVKYLLAARPPSDLPDIQGRYLASNKIPPGDWNIGPLIPNDDKKLVLHSTETKPLKDAPAMWHPAWVDEKALWDVQDDDEVEQDQEQEETLSGAFVTSRPAGIEPGPPAVAVIDWREEDVDMVVNETLTYSLIQDKHVAPRFLGHVTEDNAGAGVRAIGYLIEHLPNAREAAVGLADLDVCRDVLKRLHALGIARGGTLSTSSFLVVEGDDGTKTAFMHHFHSAFVTTDRKILHREVDGLAEALGRDWKAEFRRNPPPIPADYAHLEVHMDK